MKFMKKLINKVLCFAILANICCYPANAINDIAVCDYRFVSNAGIIECIKASVNFEGTRFKSLWATGRKGESREHLAVDTDHILYTVQLSSTLKVDEIFISAPIIDSASGSKMVGEISLSVKYGDNLQLQNVIRDFCSTDTLPDKFTLSEAKNIQYFLNAPDAPVELPVEYKKIESVSDYEEKKDDLESTKVVVEEKDKKTLGTGLSNINKISLVNVLEADE